LTVRKREKFETSDVAHVTSSALSFEGVAKKTNFKQADFILNFEPATYEHISSVGQWTIRRMKIMLIQVTTVNETR
jgi:hypothetical protein